MIKIDYETIEELKNILECDLLGTTLLFSKKLINTFPSDVDIAVDKKYIEIARKILQKNNFKEKTEQGKQIGYDNKRGIPIWEIIHLNVFEKTGFLDIHLLEKKENFKLLNPNEIIAEKIKRGRKKDLEVALEFLSLNLTKEDLFKYYTETKGLFCLDKNPKNVSYEWILKNNFKI